MRFSNAGTQSTTSTTSLHPDPPAPVVAFTSHGARIGIQCQVLGWCDRLFAHLPPGSTPIDPVRLDVTYSLIEGAPGTAASGRSVLQLMVDGELIACSSDSDRLTAVLEGDLHFRVATTARDLIFVHAGAVACGDRVIVMPGLSRAGKSTLVAALITAGATYFSDEYALFDANGMVHPYPRRFRLRPRYPHDPPGPPVAIPEGRVGSGPLPVGLVVAPVYVRGAKWRPRDLSTGEAMLTLFDNTLLARDRARESFAAFRKALLGVPAVNGLRGEADEVAQWILSRSEAWSACGHRERDGSISGRLVARPP